MTSTARWIGRWLMALLASFPVTTIGRNIKRRRERQGWSQAELAGKVGIHRISLARLEAGGKGPSWAPLERLARALRVQPGRLLD